MKNLVLCALALCLVKAEPPVPTGFSGTGGGQAYGAPGHGSGGGHSGGHGYSGGGGGSSYRAPNTFTQAPSSNAYNTRDVQYGPPPGGITPGTSYGTPSTSYSESSQGYNYNSPQSAYGAPGGGHQGGVYSGGNSGGYGKEQPMPYNFAYAVKDYYGNDYNREETSDGNVVNGQYKVLLPDGRTQVVKYTADWQNGFNAQVTYEGEAKYPEPNRGGYSGGSMAGYGAPTSGFGGSSSNYGPPSQNYGAPSQSNSQYSAPPSNYGPPASAQGSNYALSSPAQSYTVAPPPAHSYSGNHGYHRSNQGSSQYTAPPQYSTPANTYGPPSGAFGQSTAYDTQATTYATPPPLPPQQYNSPVETSITGSGDSFQPSRTGDHSYSAPSSATGKGFGSRINQRGNQGYNKK